MTNYCFSGIKFKTMQEIERKFLIDSIPFDLEKYEYLEIIQAYIAVDTTGTEVRIRKIGKKYLQTVKSKGDLIRNEYEFEISKEQFDNLWLFTEGKRLKKNRYFIDIEQHTITIDVYDDSLNGLKVAETEFKNKEEAEAFISPKWFGKEVTSDNRYKNINIVKFGLP